jgi:nitroreductase
MPDSPVDYLLSRRSVKFVQKPGPNKDELATIFQAAMRAPDHARQRPWRFAVIEGDAVARLGERVIDIVNASDNPMRPEKVATTRRWLADVPVLVAVACKLDHANQRVPEHERMLAVGAAVTNMLNAAHMLGYAAYWSTGLGTYNDEVNEALGFDALDYRFMGYVSIGTPVRDTVVPERPDWEEFVTRWQAPETQAGQ